MIRRALRRKSRKKRSKNKIINKEHVPFEEITSTQDGDGEGGGGEGGSGGGEGEGGGVIERGRSVSEVSLSLQSVSELGGDISLEKDGELLSPKSRPSQAAEEEEEERDKEEGENLWNVWSSLLKNWEESSRRNHKMIHQLVREGIPQPLRAMAWQLLSGAHDTGLRDRYPSLITEVSPFEKQIQRDLARTFPEHAFFKERDGLGQEALCNILKAYSVFDREVGYCQGSPFITGLLLLQRMPEEDAFCVFKKLMFDYKLRDLFKPSMADLGLCFYQLEKLVEELYPSLYQHFQAMEFQTSMYASPWFLTMFASVLSLNIVFRIMDIFLIEGREIIFKVGLALLEHSQSTLLQMDMEDMLKHVQKDMKLIHESDADALIQKAVRIKISQRKMKRVEKDYQQRRERESQESTELARLQQMNVELQKTVKSLEKECASLADKLIQGQVSRAQEAEEMFILKKELSKAKRKLNELEELSLRKESTESNESLREESPKIVNGETTEMKGDDGEEDGEGEGEGKGVPCECGSEVSVPNDIAARAILNSSAAHVAREEAQQVLLKLGMRPLSTSSHRSQDYSPSLPSPSPSSPLVEILEVAEEEGEGSGKNDRHYHRGITTSCAVENGRISPVDSTLDISSVETETVLQTVTSTHDVLSVSAGTSASSDMGLQTGQNLGQLTQELARVKVECAEAVASAKQKQLEVRQAQVKEAQAVRELDTARSYISILEKRLSEAQMVRLSCPHCSQSLSQAAPPASSFTNTSTVSCAVPSSSSSDVLFSHLRAMWNTQAVATTAATNSPNRVPQFGPAPNWT